MLCSCAPVKSIAETAKKWRAGFILDDKRQKANRYRPMATDKVLDGRTVRFRFGNLGSPAAGSGPLRSSSPAALPG